MPKEVHHKYDRASCTIVTTLENDTIVSLCEEAALQAQSWDTLVRRESATEDRIIYTFRNRLAAGRVTFMTFHVRIREMDGKRVLKSAIVSRRLVRSWPFPWQMKSWPNYRTFMTTLVMLVEERDARASAKVVEIAP